MLGPVVTVLPYIELSRLPDKAAPNAPAERVSETLASDSNSNTKGAEFTRASTSGDYGTDQDAVVVSVSAEVSRLLADQRTVQQLRNRDRQVRLFWENLADSSTSSLVRSPSYRYTTGPDGQRYVTSGSLNSSEVSQRGAENVTLIPYELLTNYGGLALEQLGQTNLQDQVDLLQANRAQAEFELSAAALETSAVQAELARLFRIPESELPGGTFIDITA